MMLNKKITVGVVGLLSLSSMIVLSGNASAVLEQPKWEEGDYWEYGIYEIGAKNKTRIGNMTVKIEGTETTVVDGESYNVWMVEIIEMRETSNNEKTNFWNVTRYIRKSDLARVKEIFSFISETIIYSPPINETDYPVKVGDKWERHYNRTSGIGSEEVEVDDHYECLNKKTVSIQAGSFNCYIIKLSSEDEGIYPYPLYYHSPKVGNWVKMEVYQNGSLMEDVYELVSYNYDAKIKNVEENNKIPGFEFLSFIIAMIAIILLSKGDRNAK